jgi:hypothetical protein
LTPLYYGGGKFEIKFLEKFFNFVGVPYIWVMTKVVIYHHSRNDTGEVFYIGIGNKKRPYRKDSRSSHWYSIVKKYGYTVDILYEVSTWCQACVIEIMLIEKYGRKDLGLGVLVNKTNGGDGNHGLIHSKETIDKLSKDRKGEKGINSKLTWFMVYKIRDYYRKNPNATIRELSKIYGIGSSSIGCIISNKTWYDEDYIIPIGNKNRPRKRPKGILWSDESKQKLSQTKTGAKHTKESRFKMSQSRRGEKNNRRKLTWSIVNEIRKICIKGHKEFGCKPLSKKYGVSDVNIGQIINNQIWVDENYFPPSKN